MINLPINLTSNSYIVDSIYMRMKSHMLHMKICSEPFMLSEDFRNSRINTTTCIFLQPHLINNKNVHNFLYQQEKSFFSEVFIYCCLWKFGHTTCNKHDICVSLFMYMCFCVGCICMCVCVIIKIIFIMPSITVWEEKEIIPCFKTRSFILQLLVSSE